MLFDPRTIAAAATFFFALLTVLHLLIARKQKTYPGFLHWTVCNWAIVLGMLITALRPPISTPSSIAFVAALILAAEGNRAFRGMRPRLWWLYVAGGTAILLAAYAEYLHNVNLRNVAIGSSNALNAGISAAALLRKPPKGREVGLRLTGAMYVVFGGINVVRVCYFAFTPELKMDPRFSDIFISTAPARALNVLGALSLISCSIGWLVMFYERLFVDMKRRENRARELAAREEAANRARIEFCAMVGHEIRNPLAAALNLTELVLETDLTAEQKEYELGVRTSIQALSRVTEDVLDLSKLEAGELTVESRPFDVVELTDGIAMMFRPGAAKKGLELLLECEDDTPRELIGDSGRIRQVITNLVGNSVKFTDRGRIRIKVVREVVNTSEARLCVSVSDTGIGIPPNMIPTLFERSGRAHESTSPHYGGTGIGLWISRRLIEIMGGRMALESEPSKGSTFWFELILPIAPHANAAGSH